MEHSVDRNGSKSILRLSGQITAADREPFPGVIRELLSGETNKVEIELQDVTYMDSIGLGLLITLRDAALEQKCDTALVSPRGDVKDLLKMACFDRLFEIR